MTPALPIYNWGEKPPTRSEGEQWSSRLDQSSTKEHEAAHDPCTKQDLWFGHGAQTFLRLLVVARGQVVLHTCSRQPLHGRVTVGAGGQSAWSRVSCSQEEKEGRCPSREKHMK